MIVANCHVSAAARDLNDLLDPFWLSTTSHRESVVFTGPPDKPAPATLLFRPDRIISITNAAEDLPFVEGHDWFIDPISGRLERPTTSRMPIVASVSVAALNGALTRDHTVVISYSHHDEWAGFMPAPAKDALPRLTRRLAQGEPVTICLTGDSISEGYDASGFYNLPPYQPSFGLLVRMGIQQRFASPINFHNFGTGGWTTADALWDIDRIIDAVPDLVIVAFGMNDASWIEADDYAANVSTLMAQVKAKVAGAEFVLVSPMLPTLACGWLVHSRFAEYRDRLARLAGEGAALADVTTIWSDLLTRKHPLDLSGNGWNHPNDFGHRIYAQTILAVLAGASTTESR